MRQYNQKPERKEKLRRYHRQYQQKPEVKEKKRQYQQRKRHSVSLIDVFHDAKELLSIQEIITRANLSEKEVIFSLSQSVNIGSIIKEGDEYHLNPLFASCVNGVYEEWKSEIMKRGRKWKS